MILHDTPNRDSRLELRYITLLMFYIRWIVKVLEQDYPGLGGNWTNRIYAAHEKQTVVGIASCKYQLRCMCCGEASDPSQ